MLPELTYLSFDTLSEGVGVSQVRAYVERLAQRGVRVRLHTYETHPPPADLVTRLADLGVSWSAHPFGGHGAAAGARRVLSASRLLRGAPLVHARADLAAAAAVLARCESFVWDVRSLWADQRIVLGTLRRGSVQERVLRRVERAAARRATGVVTLSAAALVTLSERHGPGVLRNAEVIPTCVDLDRFPLAQLPPGEPLRLVFSGTLNQYYDLPTMLRFVEAVRGHQPADLEVLAPGSTGWDAQLAAAAVEVHSVTPAALPGRLAASHAGLCVCRFDGGPSLRAAMPTKVAELLASGRPVVVNRGLGDLDELFAAHRCGVVIQDASAAALERAAAELVSLLSDPETPNRCRTLAEAHFDLDRGIDHLLDVYEQAVSIGRSAAP